MLLLARGTLIARALLQKERPDVVVGTGGFASTALASAQASLRRPLVLVEGNAIPGRTNRLLARSATAVCIAFDGAASFLPPGRTVRTGFPVRARMAETRGRAEARRSFGLAEERFTLLVVGGSQGALFFNNLMRAAGPRLLEDGVQILHQLGARNAGYDAPAAEGWVRLQYIEDMPSALASADVVLSRAGASTLSEMAVQGCAAILVPYPYAHADHQTANARELSSAGRALLVPEPEMTAERLVSIVSELQKQPGRAVEMGARLKEWATPDAAKRVAEVVLNAVRA